LYLWFILVSYKNTYMQILFIYSCTCLEIFSRVQSMKVHDLAKYVQSQFTYYFFFSYFGFSQIGNETFFFVAWVAINVNFHQHISIISILTYGFLIQMCNFSSKCVISHPKLVNVWKELEHLWWFLSQKIRNIVLDFFFSGKKIAV
jgi:hypothetical protein